MKKNAFTWWQALIVLGGMALLAAIVFPYFGRARECCQKPSCQSNLKQIGLGVKQYIQDYDGKFPILNSGQDGWMNVIMPYVKSTFIFQCPTEQNNSVNGIDYFYNSQLSGLEERKLPNIERTIMNGDGIGNGPPNFGLSEFPKAWVTDTNSPAWSHSGGANYAFADGHVKWMKIATNRSDSTNVSNDNFAP